MGVLLIKAAIVLAVAALSIGPIKRLRAIERTRNRKAWHGGTPRFGDLERLVTVMIWREGVLVRQMEVAGAYWGGPREGDHLMGRLDGDHHVIQRGDLFELADGRKLTAKELRHELGRRGR